MTRQKLNLIVQPGEFAVCRLDIDSPIPAWSMSSGVFVISTFDTDYLFVKTRDFFNALLVLENAGHEIDAKLSKKINAVTSLENWLNCY